MTRLRSGIASRAFLGTALLSSTLAACDPFGPGLCDLAVEPSVEVEVVDAGSGAPIAEGARGVVREGAYVDSLRPQLTRVDGTLLTLAAWNARAGTYRVEIVRDGYAAWHRDGVRVRRGDCGIETTHVRAALVPTS